MKKNNSQIEKYFGEYGFLSNKIENFEYRSFQCEMAQTITEALRNESIAIIEAGTGTGKTFGYLIPLILSGKKCVISTSTKALQEQIYHKDVPILESIFKEKVDALIMKGRNNYLCLHRYHQNVVSSSAKQIPSTYKLKLEKWLQNTEFADRSEISWLNDYDPIWDSLASTSELCLGSKCIHWKSCYFNKLRRRASKAQLVIVNHHLFFADLIIKNEGFHSSLPNFEVVVFDEAHNIEEIATTYFGKRLSTHQLIDLANDVEKEIKNNKTIKIGSLKKSLYDLESATEKINYLFSGLDSKGWLDDDIIKLINKTFSDQIECCLLNIQETEKLSLQLSVRAENILDRFKEILSINDANICAWYEKRKKSLILYASPMDISEHMKERLYSQVCSIIFTSATLSTNNNFDYIRTRLGIPEDSLESIYPSHFLFSEQTVMYVAKDLPLPNDPFFIEKISQRIIDILKITYGKALVLFTSYNNMHKVYDAIQGEVPFKIFMQGDIPKLSLLDKFKKDTDSVLMATKSFWQGVDFPGNTLTSLIIDKLPFDSPGDPLVASRISTIKNRNGNPFLEYQLPSAIISLKQGIGRLIRNKSDIGVFSILDKRIITARYHKAIIDSLPDIPLTNELSEMKKFLKTNFVDSK
jgi:ATP-dependent DNA helicase DinG